MTSVNRTDPVRAKTSASDYALMGFMREFPDDAACLEISLEASEFSNGEHA